MTTRTDYTTRLREAGFTVRPLWQGKTEFAGARSSGHDLTAYTLTTAAGIYVTDILLRDLGQDDGAAVYIATNTLSIAEDISLLHRMANERKA